MFFPLCRSRLGVPQASGNTFLLGNNVLMQSFFGLYPTFDTSVKQYNEFAAEKYYGTYGIGLSPPPILVVKDLDLIRHIFGT